MIRALVLVISLLLISSVARADDRLKTGELRFQDVVPVAGATRDRIYGSALEWFAKTFDGPKAVLEQNEAAGILTGKGAERYLPPFMSTACSGWLRYRVMLVAREGRYYFTIDGFTHEGDPFCNKRSFGLLTKDWLGARITRTIYDLT